MPKPRLSLLTALAGSLLSLAAAPTAAQPAPSLWHWVAVDSTELQIPKVDSVARRLGFVRKNPRAGEATLHYREQRAIPFSFQFSQKRPGYAAHSGAWDSTWAAGFFGGGDRFEAFLASAYLQEVRPGFRDTFPAFREYREIDPSAFNRRLWLSAGYAWQQALNDNALVPAWQKNFWVSFGYTVDAVAAVALAAAAVPGASPEQRVTAAAFALGFTAFERLLILPLGRLSIRQHNMLVRSGYRIPDFSADVQTPRKRVR
jgi:hypothetical protein